MLPKSSTITSSLQSVVEQLENKAIGYHVVGAKYYNVPLVQQKIKVQLKEYQRINLLQEHILLAGYKVKPVTNVKELSQVLGLDRVFITNEANNLAKNNFLDEEQLPFIVTTDSGIKFLQERVRVETEVVEEKIYQDPITGQYYFSNQQSNLDTQNQITDIPNFTELQENFKKQKVGQISLKELMNLLKVESYYNLGGKTKLDQIIDQTYVQVIRRALGLIVIYDQAEAQISIRVYDPQLNSFNLGYEKQFEGLLAATDDSDTILEEDLIEQLLTDLGIEKLGEEEKLVDADYEKEVKELAITQKDKAENKPSQEFKVEYLSDEQIRPKYLSLLQSAKRDVLILSAWINSFTVDDEFVNLLQQLADQRVLIIMGWGIEKQFSNKNLKLNREMSRKLASIKTPEGVNAVSLLLVGNQHKKEVIIDSKYHLLGSHNWLSYRGDRDIRGESVLYNELPQVIHKARREKKEIFLQTLQRYWFKYLRDEIIEGDTQLSIAGWVTLKAENKLLNQIKKLLQEDQSYQQQVARYLLQLSLALKGRASAGGDEQLKRYINNMKELLTNFKLNKVKFKGENFQLIDVINDLALEMEAKTDVK